MNTVLKKGTCECIAEPMGDGGLEGFNVGTEYQFEHMSKDKKGKPYYRVYHTVPTPFEAGYYETCGGGTFKQHFKVIKHETA